MNVSETCVIQPSFHKMSMSEGALKGLFVVHYSPQAHQLSEQNTY